MPGNGPSVDSKICISCGRSFEWRKRWQSCWEQVRYCSKACRHRGVTSFDRKLEEAILDLLSSRSRGSSICPSEIARSQNAEDWRKVMEPVRRAARRLCARGRVLITQKGQVVDPSLARGPIRIRLR